jgi:hypothetical protein
MTIQALSSFAKVSAQPAGRFFLRRLVEALLNGRQRKADRHIAEYLDRHPEHRQLFARSHDHAPARERRSL